MEVITLSFNKDIWTIENHISLSEEFTSDQRLRMCDVLIGYAQILKELEHESSDIPDIVRDKI